MPEESLLNVDLLVEKLKQKKTLLDKQDIIIAVLLDFRNDLVNSGVCSDTLVRGALRDAGRTDQYWVGRDK